jgi:hypothetical protein
MNRHTGKRFWGWLAAVLLIAPAGCDSPINSAGGAGAGGTEANKTGNPIISLSVADTPAAIDGEANTITVFVPYYQGFNPKSLDVSVELEENAAVIPALAGPQDFSRPKKITVRSADGATGEYTVTVYALFSGPESLAGLAGYTNWNGDEGGTAPMPDPAKPLYIALEGIDLNGTTVPSIEPVAVYETYEPLGTNSLMRIFGVEESWYHHKVPGYTHDQYIALDLSRYTTETALQGGSLPLGDHTDADGGTYYADGPFSRVTAINFPPALRILGKSLFQGNKTLTSIELPPGLVTIDYAAFAGALNLKTVNLPTPLKTIGTYAFMDTALESVNLPEGLTQIGLGAFSKTKIKRVTLPSSVTAVNRSFGNIPTLEYADFSRANIESISSIIGGFTGCGLKEVYLPESLLRLGMFSVSFAGSRLEKMVIYAPMPPEMEEEWSYWNQSTFGEPTGPYTGFASGFKIYVPDASVNAYKTANGLSAGWAQYADKIHPVSEL